MGDPNWLLATVVLSTSLIVGLAGVYLVHGQTTAPGRSESRRALAVVSWIGYMVLIGMFLPLALMPADAAAFDPAAVWSFFGLELSGPAWKRLVLLGFGSGVLLVLGGLGWTVLKNARR